MAFPRIEGCRPYPELMLQLSLRAGQANSCDTEANYENCARHELAASGQMPQPRRAPNGEMLGELKK